MDTIHGDVVKVALALCAAIGLTTWARAGSFALLALIPVRPMRELAFVMAAGILVDTFLVRSVLVSSLAASFGPISWWPNSPPQPEPDASFPNPGSG